MGAIINFISNLAYAATEPNFIGKLVRGLFNALGGTGKYWLTVMLFTLFLKILTLPLDYWQRLSGRKNQLKLEKIKPQMEALQKKYADDKNALTMKQQELYKSVGYSPLGACLPMIVMIVIMIVMFGGLRTFSEYKQIEEFNALKGEYYAAVQIYVDDYFEDKLPAEDIPVIINSAGAFELFDKWYLADTGRTEIPPKADTAWWSAYSVAWTEFNDELESNASTAVWNYFENNRETFIWIKNIWRSDNFWTTPVPDADDFKALLSDSQKRIFDDIEYDSIMKEIVPSMGSANGYLILPLLAMVLMFFSSKITSRNQQTGMPQSDATQRQAKMMQWMMPIMMGVFGLMYTSAIALYMIMNSVYTVLLSFLINWLVGLQMKKHEEKTGNRPGYRR